MFAVRTKSSVHDSTWLVGRVGETTTPRPPSQQRKSKPSQHHEIKSTNQPTNPVSFITATTKLLFGVPAARLWCRSAGRLAQVPRPCRGPVSLHTQRRREAGQPRKRASRRRQHKCDVTRNQGGNGSTDRNYTHKCSRAKQTRARGKQPWPPTTTYRRRTAPRGNRTRAGDSPRPGTQLRRRHSRERGAPILT